MFLYRIKYLLERLIVALAWWLGVAHDHNQVHHYEKLFVHSKAVLLLYALVGRIQYPVISRGSGVTHGVHL